MSDPRQIKIAIIENNTWDIQTFETEQFSLGGSNSLRGYRELSFYGDYRLSMNYEMRYIKYDYLNMVAFLDIGVIGDEFQETFQSVYYGYGAGIRLMKFLLPLRLDIAYGNDLMLHLNLSHTF